MEKSILLHCISPDELKLIIKEVIKDEIKAFANDDSETLLSRKEACELLKINFSSLWKHTKSGKLTSYGIGNRVYYKKGEVLLSIKKINK